MTPRAVIRRIRALDRSAYIAHQDGSHQKWRSTNDIPIGTLQSIERQGVNALGPGWLSVARRGQ